MFPQVTTDSFIALKKFCHKKDFIRTKSFVYKVWNKKAINEMMKISSTSDLDSLINWLINPDLDTKISAINNYYN